MSRVGRAAIFIVIAGTSAGMKFSHQSAVAREIKMHMLDVCETDNICVQTIEDRFDSCFETHYSGGSRRNPGSLDAENMARCVNQYGGARYFAGE
ncbi:MAG: hypothetical protein AAFQ41_05965 [Cyanobacteria bacterium J06623_7]